MRQGEWKIHSNKGKVFDCVCVVGVECDEETIAFRFPQLEQEDDDIGPMVYAHMRGTELRVTLCSRENARTEFAWDEDKSAWHMVQAPNHSTARAISQTNNERIQKWQSK